MEPVIDIFLKLPDGSPLWVECVEGLHRARARVKELKRIAPRDYILYSERNGVIYRENYPEV